MNRTELVDGPLLSGIDSCLAPLRSRQMLMLPKDGQQYCHCLRLAPVIKPTAPVTQDVKPTRSILSRTNSLQWTDHSTRIFSTNNNLSTKYHLQSTSIRYYSIDLVQ